MRLQIVRQGDVHTLKCKNSGMLIDGNELFMAVRTEDDSIMMVNIILEKADLERILEKLVTKALK